MKKVNFDEILAKLLEAQVSLGNFVTTVTNWIKTPHLHNSTSDIGTFYRATRDDTDVSVAYGVGSGGINHGVWSEKQGRWLIYGDETKAHIPAWEGGVIIASGSKTVNASTYYDLCSITLQPNRRYIILAHVATNNGTTFEIGAFFGISGTMPAWVTGQCRTTTGSGQGVTSWAYGGPGNNTATVTLRCYGYYTTSHTETGTLCAIPVPYLNGQ